MAGKKSRNPSLHPKSLSLDSWPFRHCAEQILQKEDLGKLVVHLLSDAD